MFAFAMKVLSFFVSVFCTQDTWHKRGPSGASTRCLSERSSQSAVSHFCLGKTWGYRALVLTSSEVSACFTTQSLRPVIPGFASKELSRVGQQFLDGTGRSSKQTFWTIFLMSWQKRVRPVRAFTWARRHHSCTILIRVRSCPSSKVNVLFCHNLKQIQFRKHHIFSQDRNSHFSACPDFLLPKTCTKNYLHQKLCYKT